MPNTTAAKKAQRQNEKRRVQNKAQTSQLRTALRNFRESLAKGVEFAKNAFKSTQALLAKAAQKKLIHRNKASRLTSRMSEKLKKVS